MLDLYESDYEEYVKRIKDKFVPPSMPRSSAKPVSPELSDEMQKIAIEFRKNNLITLSPLADWTGYLA